MSTPTRQPAFQLLTSRNFSAWLSGQRASLVFTTYQAGKVFMLGINPDGTLHVTERSFPRCMGFGGNAQTFYLSSRFQLWRFENSLPPGQVYQQYDRVYLPQMAYTTGDLDIHDVALDAAGRPVFVNTLFSCLATVSETHSFRPLWQPPFISRLAPEDRCHLNGLAMRDEQPAYATAVSRSDVGDGWRDRRQDGGLLLDVSTNEIVCEGLSMPHSPRWHQGRLWLLNAGTGHLGYVDLDAGRFEPVCFCPGFLRGLAFVGDYAVVGLSAVRKNGTFQDLPLQANLEKHHVEARCGLQIINLQTGAAEEWVRLEGVVDELYDVQVLPGVRRPLLIGTQREEIRRMVSIEA